MDPRIQALMDAGMEFPSGVTQDMIDRVNAIPAADWPAFLAGVSIADGGNPPSSPVLQYIAFQFRNGQE
jgi:hypothetical protein